MGIVAKINPYYNPITPLGGVLEIFFLLLGLAGLWFSSELVISGARNIANYFRLSPLFIGLTIVALGTDLPELFVSITAGLEKIQGVNTSGFAVGNIIGSSMGQAVLILGIIIAISNFIKIPKQVAKRDASMLVVGSALVLLMALDGFLSVVDGLILITVYGIYIFSVLREENGRTKPPMKTKPNFWWAAISIVAGFFALAYSAEITLDHSLALAEQLGVSQSIIGITIVGIGTSLPELATSLVALKNKAPDLAIGNVIGSTVFDLLFALGIGASFAGFSIEEDILFDLAILVTGMALVYGLLRLNKTLEKQSGYFLVGFFIAYLIVIVEII